MKKLVFSLVAVMAFSWAMRAQECTPYFPAEEGKELVYQFYDAKDKPTLKAHYRVVDVKDTPDGLKITIENWYESTAEKEKKKKKEEEMLPDTLFFDYYCKGGRFYIDMTSALSKILGMYQEADLDIQSNDLVLPSDLKVGQTLPDAGVTVVVRGDGGIKLVTITSNALHRRVAEKEKVTTPAGTFDCYKITYDVEGKVGFVKTHAKGATWYAKGVGTVRSESYDKKGKLQSYQVLEEIR